MPSKPEILDAAIASLRNGEALTIDALARATGLTKPGVVHHFPTKDVLASAVVDRIADRWEADMLARTPDGSDPLQRLRAYVDFALTGQFDTSDLALLADPRLRDSLLQQWVDRLDPWFGIDIEGPLERRAQLRAARTLADGAWFNKALGLSTMTFDEEAVVHEIAKKLLNNGDSSQ